MAKKNTISSDVNMFFNRLKGQDTLRKSDSLTILDVPQTEKERLVKQKIQSVVNFVKTKTWQRRHVEYFEEYRRMVNTFPIIKAAIDIYGEEACAKNTDGFVFSIKSDNKAIKEELEYLFFKVLNMNTMSFKIVRHMCQFGNVYGNLRARPKEGVTDIIFLPPEAMIRDHMYDPSNIDNYRFVWYGAGGGSIFEPWEIVHWRNSEDIEMEPYGSSILRPILDTWRRVVLIREALVIYRITRAPSKLLFKIDTTGLTAEEANRFAQEMKKEITKKPLVNPQTGELDFKYNPMPLHKDTLIPTLSGEIYSIEQLSAKLKQKEKDIWVYSIQDNTNQIVPGKVTWAGKNYTANRLIRVWLDDQTYIDSAPEHPFIVYVDESKTTTKQVSAEELKSGDSLVPFYQQYKKIDKKTNEYHQTYNPASGKFEFTHRLIAKEIAKEDEQHTVVHHVDFNRFNNEPVNLQWMNFHEHRAYHRSLNKQNQSHLALLPYAQSEENKQRASQLFSKINQNRKDDLKLREKWISNISKTISNFVWNSLRLAIQKGEISSIEDAKSFILNSPKLISSINKSSKIVKNKDSKVSLSLLNKSAKQRGYINFNAYIRSCNKQYKHDKLFFKLYNLIRTGEITKYDELLCFVSPTFTEKEFIECLRERGFKSYETYFIATLNKGKLRQIQFDTYVWEQVNIGILTNRINNYSTAKHYINSNTELCSYISQLNNRAKLTCIEGCTIKNKIREKGFLNIYEYINYIQQLPSKLNHKVSKVEVLHGVSEDVYCMTVVGPNGEDDRHNFAVLGRYDEERYSNSGIFVKNSIDENYFIPVQEGSPSDIQVLEGASNLDAVEDYKIIKDDLFAGLKIPKSFLSFEEDLSNKAALSEEDVRFAKTIQRIQSEFVEGLLHIALVHLFLKGFSKTDLEDFEIEMNNPSVASEKKKLELVEARINIAKVAWDYNNPSLNLMSYVDVLKSILKFTNEEVEQTIRAQFAEKKIAWRLQQLYANGTYEEPEVEKKLAELKGLGVKDGEMPTGFEGLNFDASTFMETVRKKIDEEIKEVLTPVKAIPTKKHINTLLESSGNLVQNLQQTKKDFGLE